jgi:hypothetical protein
VLGRDIGRRTMTVRGGAWGLCNKKKSLGARQLSLLPLRLCFTL